jgi:hypothetical protein
MTTELDWIIHQQNQKTEFQRKQQEVRERQNAALERQTTTKHTTIPNMTDAMKQVRSVSSDYPEEYKDFIRRTSGRPV